MSSNVVQSRAPGAQEVAQDAGVGAVLQEAADTEPGAQAAGERGGQPEPLPGLEYFNTQLARMQDAANMLNEQALANKRELRKGKIANSVAPIKSAAGKRTVGFWFLSLLHGCLCSGR